MWSKHTIKKWISIRGIHLPENHLTVCLNILHVSLRCCIILSPMTESKIGHLRSTRDITLLGLIGTDWRGEREGGRLRVTHKYDVTRPFQKRFCLPFFFFGIKKSFICLSIWDNCISDKQPPQIGFSCPERRRHFFYDQDDHKGHHLARKTQLLI